jgi:recombination protein RecA
MDERERERRRQIDLALMQMEKQFGRGCVLRLGTQSALPVDVIPSGSISLDAALGVGGFPRGRVIEIFGPESSGKTTIALHLIAEAQKAGGTAVFIDAEHALDASYASNLGVDTANLLVSQPDNGEQALEIASALVNSQSMSQALRKLTGAVARANACLVFINQVREKIGVMFGNPETTTGGRALKFYASVRVEVRRTAAIKEGEATVGNRTKIKVVKNKVAAPFREAEVDILYGQGISKEGDLLDVAAARNLIEKSGSWYSFRGERIGQGRENARHYLREHPEVRGALERELRKAFGFGESRAAVA